VGFSPWLYGGEGFAEVFWLRGQPAKIRDQPKEGESVEVERDKGRV